MLPFESDYKEGNALKLVTLIKNTGTLTTMTYFKMKKCVYAHKPKKIKEDHDEYYNYDDD